MTYTVTTTADMISPYVFAGVPQEGMTFELILTAVTDHFKVPYNTPMIKMRSPRIVLMRTMAMKIVKDLLGLSSLAIGKLFGGFDHTTVLYSISVITLRIDFDYDTRKHYQAIMKILKPNQ